MQACEGALAGVGIAGGCTLPPFPPRSRVRCGAAHRGCLFGGCGGDWVGQGGRTMCVPYSGLAYSVLRMPRAGNVSPTFTADAVLGSPLRCWPCHTMPPPPTQIHNGQLEALLQLQQEEAP